MSYRHIHIAAVSSWFIAILGSLGTRVALAAGPLALSESAVWLLLIAIPALTLVFDRRGPSPTIAQILYDTELATVASPIDLS